MTRPAQARAYPGGGHNDRGRRWHQGWSRVPLRRDSPGHVTPIAPTGNDGVMSAPQQSDGDPARDAGTPRAVITDGLPSQLPDTDPDETQEWLDSLDAVVDNAGRERARYVMLRLLERSREQQVGVPSTDHAAQRVEDLHQLEGRLADMRRYNALGLPPLKPETPWHGYDLGVWPKNLERQAAMATHVSDNRGIDVRAADSFGTRVNDRAVRYDRDVRRTTADIGDCRCL